MEKTKETTPRAEDTAPQEVHDAMAEKDLGAASLEDGPAEHLSPEHRQYLLSRHKTLDLNPLPTMDPADPLNWPAWKVQTPFHKAPSHADHGRKTSISSSLLFTP
jgi:hypothetical protein